MVDGLPVVPPEKTEKLLGIVRKVFGQVGDMRDGSPYMPMSEDGSTSLGICFIEYDSPGMAQRAINDLNGFGLDKKHIFRVNPFDDIERFAKVRPAAGGGGRGGLRSPEGPRAPGSLRIRAACAAAAGPGRVPAARGAETLDARPAALVAAGPAGPGPVLRAFRDARAGLLELGAAQGGRGGVPARLLGGLIPRLVAAGQHDRHGAPAGRGGVGRP